MEFFPSNKRTEEYFTNLFNEKELSEVIKLHKAQASQKARKYLTLVNTQTCILFEPLANRVLRLCFSTWSTISPTTSP